MIKELENKIKDIFNQDKIRIMDVIIANRLIEDWKRLTNYKENIIDELPIYQYYDTRRKSSIIKE